MTIDNEWPWLVCFAAGLANFLASGGTRSMGIMFVELQQRFNTNAGITGLVLGFTAAGFAIFSVIGNVLVSFCGNRLVVLAGAAVTFVSLLLTSFAPDIYFVVVILGFAAGIGYGFIFGPSMVVVGQYFNKRRALANGLAVAGGSLGQVVMPFILVSLVNTFNFQGGIMLYSAIALHAIPAGLLLRPRIAKQKIEDAIVVTDDCHTEDSKLTWQMGKITQTNNIHLQTSNEISSNSARLHYNDARFLQNNLTHDEVSYDEESWMVPWEMNNQSLFKMHDLGLGYSDAKSIMTPAVSSCKEFKRRCTDPDLEENGWYERTTQTSFLEKVLGNDTSHYKGCKTKSDEISKNTERDDHFNRTVEHNISKSHSKQSLEESSEGKVDELENLLHNETEYDILDEISRECSIRNSMPRENEDNNMTEDNASESGTLRSELKDEFSTRLTDSGVSEADNLCSTENVDTELKHSFSDIFKPLVTPVARIDFDIGESFDFNFSIGSLNFDEIEQKKTEKSSSEQIFNHDFSTNCNDDRKGNKNSSNEQKKKCSEHNQKSIPHRKRSKKHRKRSDHRKKSSEHKKKSSEHRTRTRQQKIRPTEQQLTLTENMETNCSLVPDKNCKILKHSSDKICSGQQETVNCAPTDKDSSNPVPNCPTQQTLNSEEWSGFLKSNALFSSNEFVFDDSTKTSSSNDLASLLHDDLDSNAKETPVMNPSFQNAAATLNFKHPTFYQCCKLFVSKVLDQRLMSNWSYLLFATGLGFSHSGYMNGCFFLPVFATEMGHTNLTMAVLISTMGIADLAGRIAGGFLVDQRTFKITTLLGSFLVTCGLLALLMTSYPRLWVLVLYGILHSLLCGAYMSLLVKALIDVVGTENLGSGIGFSTLITGLFMLPTPSILGLVQEATGSFTLSLRICGLFLTAGGIIFYIQPFIQKFQHQRMSSSPQNRATDSCQNFRAVETFHFKVDDFTTCQETVV